MTFAETACNSILPCQEHASFEVSSCSVRILNIWQLAEHDILRVANTFPNRNSRASQFHFLEDRLRCLGAGVLLMDEVGIEREDQIKSGANGKPMALGLGLPHFNLSHSGNYVMVATASHPVGADIERIDERHLPLAKRVFTESEQLWMEHDPLERFYILWTQKEAVMKLDGRGLALDPITFEMNPSGATAATLLGEQKVIASSFRYHDCIVSIAQYYT